MATVVEAVADELEHPPHPGGQALAAAHDEDGAAAALARENNRLRAAWATLETELERLLAASYHDPADEGSAAGAYDLAILRAQDLVEDTAVPQDEPHPPSTPDDVIHEHHPAEHLTIRQTEGVVHVALTWVVAGARHQATHVTTPPALTRSLTIQERS